MLRRKYLASMAAALEPDDTLDESILAPEGFWQDMAKDMVQRSFDLIDTIDDFFKLRATKLGFAAILYVIYLGQGQCLYQADTMTLGRIFGLYISGSVSLYLQRWPTRKFEFKWLHSSGNESEHLQFAPKRFRTLQDIWNWRLKRCQISEHRGPWQKHGTNHCVTQLETVNTADGAL